MDKNISNSNSRLADAAKARPDTRPRVDASKSQAQKVSEPKKSDEVVNGTRTQQAKKALGSESKKGRPNRPSYEGLMNSRSAHIQVNKTGYDNQKHQKARNNIIAKKNMPMNIKQVSSAKMPSSLRKSAIINNYSKTSFSQSTKSSMDKMLKTDNYFR